jgi:copper transport protein
MLVQAESLIEWSDAAFELVGVVAALLATGAVGFRYAARRGHLASTDATESERLVFADAAQRAAALGLIGALARGWLLARSLPQAAARAHVTVGQLVSTDLQAGARVVLALAAILGLLVAAARRRIGWPIAAVGVLGGFLTSALVGQFSRLVNPMHEMAAGLWIGTLFMLVVAGISAVLRDEPVGERRGAIIADMVNGFSPLALAAGALVVIFGVITAWRHLHTIDALWTTPYGLTLCVKLVLVAIVFALGAWNWRRQRPTLGTEPAAVAIRRSARAELTVAALVLLVTSVLLVIPAPRPPGAPRAGAPAGAPTAP